MRAVWGVKFSVLALDYDGRSPPMARSIPTYRRAIADARRRGITVVIVTGRILDELRGFVGDLRFVDAVVAENGGVIAFPESGRSALLASAAPPQLVEALRRKGLPIEVGQSVIEADAQWAGAVLAEVHRLELPQVIIFNRSRAIAGGPRCPRRCGSCSTRCL